MDLREKIKALISRYENAIDTQNYLAEKNIQKNEFRIAKNRIDWVNRAMAKLEALEFSLFL